ncbi:MAG: polysaccharide export protein [Aquificae bacterium]|nr:polysaccharide export protein [Aquificota bacterium]
MLALLLALLILTGCAHMLPQSGPSTAAVKSSDRLVVLTLTPSLARTLERLRGEKLVNELKGLTGEPYQPAIGVGDVLEVTLYESPPPALLTSVSGGASLTLPPQRVDDEGFITVPFVGRVKAAGRRPEELASEIRDRLKGQAHEPQVLVRVLAFNSSTVTVMGHVAKNGRVPLDYNTLTLLDVLATAGGVTSPVNKTLIKLSRNGKTVTVALKELLRNPSLNPYLRPGDVITVVYKTQSATFLGAFGSNKELEFEASGITLAQALGRVGGLRGDLAHAKGVFLFRFEDGELLKKLNVPYRYATPEGKVPVVYNVDLSNPASMFVLKEFKLRDGDIVYVADAPAVQLGKFLGMLRDVIQPVFMIDVMSR